MNLLIIGGLLAVGVVAILGAVLLGMSEQRAENTKKNLAKQTIPVTRSEPANHRTVDEAAATKPVGAINRAPAADETALITMEGEQLPPSLNGQFHELAGEIRTLHQQARQLEQRLGVLSEMINHIEQTQSDYTDVEEEAEAASDHTA